MEKIKKYSNEYEYLIHLIKCAIHDNQPDEKPDALSFDKVFEYGKEHEVANIAFVSVQKLKSKPDNDLYKKWKMMYAFSIQRHAKQMHARNEMVEAFNHAQIRNVEVQGSRLKTLYPEPGWRMMSDIDFIIDIENLFHAEKILCDLGYNTKNVNDAEVDGFGANGIAIEIHTDFFHSNTKFSNKKILRPKHVY